MRSIAFVGFLVILITVLSACQTQAPAVTTPISAQPTETTVESIPIEPPTEPTEPPTEPTIPTEPEHSSLYIPGISKEDMQTYFNEVVLNMEYSDGTGDSSLVQKWYAPIRYITEGEPTPEDMAVLEDLFAKLNEIPGFPGIYPADDPMEYNLTLSFLDGTAFQTAFSDLIQGETADGAVRFWYYTLSNEIHTGHIGYRTDISQNVRNSVLPEEIINLLGISDSVLREDSIVYQYSSDALELSDVDWTILKLLYDPAIECGMDETACREILEQLYF